MNFRELSNDMFLNIEADVNETAECLQEFKPGEAYKKTFSYRVNKNLNDTTQMTNYINALKEAGLDIGKGDAEFGYKMPLPEGEVSQRELHIFRRK